MSGKRSHQSADELVAVFEGQTQQDVDRIKAILWENGIESEVEESPMVFPNIPTEITLKVVVKLRDENKAFQVIDQHVKPE